MKIMLVYMLLQSQLTNLTCLEKEAKCTDKAIHDKSKFRLSKTYIYNPYNIYINSTEQQNYYISSSAIYHHWLVCVLCFILRYSAVL